MSDEDLDKLWSETLEETSDEETRAELEAVRNGRDSIELMQKLMQEGGGEVDSDSLHALILEMNIPERIKLAMFGNKIARALLIRDTNKQIPLFVLQNAGLQEEELLEFMRNTQLDQLVFRAVSRNNTWMKNYAIKLAMVSNPKTPADLSLKWIKHLRERDLRNLAKSKNIPQVIATQCRKLVERRNRR